MLPANPQLPELLDLYITSSGFCPEFSNEIRQHIPPGATESGKLVILHIPVTEIIVISNDRTGAHHANAVARTLSLDHAAFLKAFVALGSHSYGCCRRQMPIDDLRIVVRKPLNGG